MAINIYKSIDASAPVLTGQVGSLPALLDACLVNGYGAKAALGWGKPFTGTNSAVYRAATGLRHYVQIADNGADATNTVKVATAIGFETMSAFNTGTGLFPTTAMLATGVWWNKSITADATARPWWLVGDDKTFYMTIYNGTAPVASACMFGEIETYKSGDAYNSAIGGSGATPNASGVSTTSASVMGQAIGNTGVTELGFYAARSYTQVGTATLIYPIGPVNTNTVLGQTGITYPNVVDGGLYLDPIPIGEPIAGGPIRGRMRGMFAPLHPIPLSLYDTVVNPVGLPGRTVIALSTYRNGSAGMMFADLTGPW